MWQLDTPKVAETNASLTGLCFFLVFCGWSAMSNIATSTRGNTGSYSLSIVYFTLTVANLITAKLISRYQPKYIMLFGSLSYGLCVASNIAPIPIILYIMSFFVGVGAAAIWVAQQLYITQCSNYYEKQNNLELNSKLGYFNGLFYMIYSFKKIIGNFIGAFTVQIGFSLAVMYAILTALCFIGSLGFLLLKPMNVDTINHHMIQNKEEVVNLLESESESPNETETISHTEILSDSGKTKTSQFELLDNENIELTLSQSICKIFELWKNRNLWSLVPFTLYCGMDSAFVNGVFPLFCRERTEYKFYIISYSGLVLCIFSMITGKLSDKIGRISIILISACCQSLVYIWSIRTDFKDANYTENIWYLLGLSTLIGISGSGYLTQISAVYPIILGKKPEVFANLKLFQSLTMASSFYMETKLNIDVIAKINLVMLVIGLMPLIIDSSVRTKLQKTAGK